MMFTRADMLLPSARPSSFESQVIGFYWEEFDPHLLIVDEHGSIRRRPLGSVDLIVSEARRCVGYHDEEGYHPCPDRAGVRGFSQCERCASTWIPKITCLFEPECDGTRCDSPICSREHFVYVAYTGGLIKMGMTGSCRLRTRGIEQGADAIAPLLLARNRKEAREIENRVSASLRLPQRLRAGTLARELFRLPSPDELLMSHRRLLERLRGSFDPLEEEPKLLRDYPASRLRQAPKPVKTPGFHTGRVLGIKGRFLVYEDAETGTPRMLNLGDLPSRFVSERY